MIDYYLIRHGEAEVNLKIKELIGGRWNDSKLNKRGYEQSKALGRRFLEEEIKFEEVHTGSADRQIDSTIIVCREIGFLDGLIVSDDLLELSQGEWEGRERGVFSEEVKAKQRKNVLDWKAPGGESLREVQTRMMDYMLNIKDRIYEDGILKKVLIISSANAIRAAINGISGFSALNVWGTSVNHMAVFQFRYSEDNGWGSLTENDCWHLRSVGYIPTDRTGGYY